MAIAQAVAKRTTCTRALDRYGGIGAALVEAESNRILGIGYTGSLPGQPHCIEVGCQIIPPDEGCHRTIHAEQNALLFAKPFDGDKTLYTTVSPCLKCLQFAILKGVKRVVFRDEYRLSGPQIELCSLTGVLWQKLVETDHPLTRVKEFLRNIISVDGDISGWWARDEADKLLKDLG